MDERAYSSGSRYIPNLPNPINQNIQHYNLTKIWYSHNNHTFTVIIAQASLCKIQVQSLNNLLDTGVLQPNHFIGLSGCRYRQNAISSFSIATTEPGPAWCTLTISTASSRRSSGCSPLLFARNAFKQEVVEQSVMSTDRSAVLLAYEKPDWRSRKVMLGFSI